MQAAIWDRSSLCIQRLGERHCRGEIVERAKSNIFVEQRLPDARMTQSFDFQLTLPTVGRIQLGPASGMAREFGHAGRQISQQVDQARQTDCIRTRLALSRLTVKATAIANPWRHSSQRDRKFVRQLDDERAYWFLQMNMLVRIQVRRIPAC